MLGQQGMLRRKIPGKRLDQGLIRTSVIVGRLLLVQDLVQIVLDYLDPNDQLLPRSICDLMSL